MPGVVHDFFHQPSFPNGAAIENHLKQCLTCELNFWDHYHPTLSYTLTIKPCLRCSGGPQENRRLMTQPIVHPHHLSPAQQGLQGWTKKAQWGFIVPETRRTSQKKSSKSWVNVCYFYPLNLFPPKSWENTPASFTWPRKNDSWKTSFLLGWPIFRGYVSSRGGYPIIFKIKAKVLEGKNRFPEPTFFQWNTHKLNLRIIFPIWHLWKYLWNSITLWGW